MVLHDYLTSISCEICSYEFSVEGNLKEQTMRRIASMCGCKVIDGKDVCQRCAEKREKKDD